MNDKKIKITHPERILTLANLISLLRAFLVIPILILMSNSGNELLLFIIIVIAVASDALDGYFARRAREVTHVGKWLDPLADSLVISSVMLFLVLYSNFPMWFFIFLMVRYLTISIGGIYIINHTHFVNAANKPGKWATAMLALTLTLHVFTIPNFEWLGIISLWAAFGFMVVSWSMYIKRLYIEFKKI